MDRDIMKSENFTHLKLKTFDDLWELIKLIPSERGNLRVCGYDAWGFIEVGEYDAWRMSKNDELVGLVFLNGETPFFRIIYRNHNDVTLLDANSTEYGYRFNRYSYIESIQDDCPVLDDNDRTGIQIVRCLYDFQQSINGLIDEAREKHEAAVREQKRLEDEETKKEAEAWAEVCKKYPEYRPVYNTDNGRWMPAPFNKVWYRPVLVTSSKNYVTNLKHDKLREASEESLVKANHDCFIRNDPDDLGVTKKCRDCGKWFYLDEKHIGWFDKRDWSIPNRCESCRHRRKVG